MIFFLKPRIWSKGIRLRHLSIWVGAVIAAHVVAMVALEGMTIFEAIWLTATTIVTVGYGDLSAKTELGRVATMLLYGAGIFTLAATINEIQEASAIRRDRKRSGQWKWKMKDHIVFVSPNTGQHEDFVADVVQELRATGNKQHVLLVSLGEKVGLPTRFEALDIAIVRASKLDDRTMAAACLTSCHTTILLDDDVPTTGSAFVVDTLSRLQGHSTCHFIVEAVGEDEGRIKRLGAERVVRPFRVYPELLAREIVAPGSAGVVQELFSATGTTLVRVDMPKTIFERWDNSVLTMMRAHYGTPIAFYSEKDGIVCDPLPDQPYFIDALYVVAPRPERTQGAADKIYELLTTHGADF